MQILQSGPTEESLRARAFKQDMNAGLQAAGNAQRAMQQQEALNLRQRALQEQQNLQDLALSQELTQKSGEVVTPEQVRQIRQTGDFELMAGDGMGPPQSGLERIVGTIANRNKARSEQQQEMKRQERIAEQEARKLDMDLKRQKLADANKPFSETREAQKMAYEQSLKGGGSGFDAEREVPGVGVALTKQDAKDLKDAKVQKDKFDRQLGELINLRKEYGGEIINREAVARGKQLSKDLLLTYKNLAKLGVLSQSDEAIINAIIPSDPLEFNFVPGQDPTLSNLEKFRGDLEADYQSRLGAKLDPRTQGQSIATQPPAQFNPQQGYVLQKPINQMTPQERAALKQDALNKLGTAQR